jgi:hypothetical protein
MAQDAGSGDELLDDVDMAHAWITVPEFCVGFVEELNRFLRCRRQKRTFLDRFIYQLVELMAKVIFQLLRGCAVHGEVRFQRKFD